MAKKHRRLALNHAVDSFTPTSQQWLVLAGLGILLCLWFIAKWKARPRENGARSFRSEFRATDRQAQEVRDDMAALLTELQRLSSNMSTQLDEKYARLGDALRDADQRIAALRALARAATVENVSPPVPISEFAEPAASTLGEETLMARVHGLADEGLTPLEIAARLEHPIGEVQLILNLRAAARR